MAEFQRGSASTDTHPAQRHYRLLQPHYSSDIEGQRWAVTGPDAPVGV